MNKIIDKMVEELMKLGLNAELIEGDEDIMPDCGMLCEFSLE